MRLSEMCQVLARDARADAVGIVTSGPVLYVSVGWSVGMPRDGQATFAFEAGDRALLIVVGSAKYDREAAAKSVIEATRGMVESAIGEFVISFGELSFKKLTPNERASILEDTGIR